MFDVDPSDRSHFGLKLIFDIFILQRSSEGDRSEIAFDESKMEPITATVIALESDYFEPWKVIRYKEA